MTLTNLHLPAPEFSWSLSRHSAFTLCKRRYYHRYHGAAGGWDKFADEKARRTYLLKNLKTKHQWVSGLFRKCVRDELLSGSPASPFEREKSARRSLLRAVGLDLVSLRKKEWASDPRKPNLLETYYKREDLFSIHDFAEKFATDTADMFEEAGVLREIFSADYLSVRQHDTPDFFFESGVKVWVAPDAALAEKGVLRMHALKPCGSAEDGDPAMENALLKLYAAEKHRTPPERSRPRIHIPGRAGGLESLEEHAPLPQAKNMIRESAADMLSMIEKDGAASEDMFPRSEGGRCAACPFRENCEE